MGNVSSCKVCILGQVTKPSIPMDMSLKLNQKIVLR